MPRKKSFRALIIERQVQIPENSLLIGSPTSSLEREHLVTIQSTVKEDNHCRCCPNHSISLMILPGRAFVIKGEAEKVYKLIDLIFLEIRTSL